MQEEFRLRKTDDFIKLGQLMKAAGLSDTGSDAKDEILSGNVKVNDEVELRRGRKLRDGDTVSFGQKVIRVIK